MTKRTFGIVIRLHYSIEINHQKVLLTKMMIISYMVNEVIFAVNIEMLESGLFYFHWFVSAPTVGKDCAALLDVLLDLFHQSSHFGLELENGRTHPSHENVIQR